LISCERKIVRDAAQIQARLAELARPVVFTNGCFDILHRGHVAYLEQAAALGRSLVIGVNSDASARRLNKGENRPINTLDDRMAILAALGCVSLVVPFEDDTPLELILALKPGVLVKGGDWPAEAIVGAREVRAWGGSVHSIAFAHQRSTTGLLARVRATSSR